MVFGKRRSLNRGSGISWSMIVIEVVSIILGVTLAFLVNEWRADRRDQRMAKTALRSITSEIQDNQALLDPRIAYYRSMQRQIDSLMQAGQRGLIAPGNLDGWRGFSPPALRSSSFEAALATEAFAHLDFETAETLSRLYALQNFYMKAVDKYLDVVLQSDREDRTMQRGREIFSEMATIGEEVSGAYAQVLRTLPSPDDAP